MNISSGFPQRQALNNLRLTGLRMARSTEQLSSGLRLNRAADDAAGMAIHHSFETKTRGLAQAARNVQDGISATRTADGGLAEITDVLQRARELAVQSGNGTYTLDQRTAMQAELQQLLDEVDKMALTTQFNGLTLLAGGAAPSLTVTINPGQTINVGQVLVAPGTPTLVLSAPFGVNAGSGYPDMRVTAPNGVQFGYSTPYLSGSGPSSNSSNSASSTATYNGYNALNEQMTFTNPIAGNWTVLLNNLGSIPVTVDMSGTLPFAPINPTITLQVGSDNNQTYTLKMVDARTGVIGLTSVSLLTQATAGAALTALDSAISTISGYRSSYGAAENRLEAELRSIESSREAATDADSRVADTDMASTLTTQVRSQILSQSGMSTLANMNLDARRHSEALLSVLNPTSPGPTLPG